VTATDLYNKVAASSFDYSATGAVRKMKLGNGLWETADRSSGAVDAGRTGDDGDQ
jgi:hypothetical protein